MAQFILKTGNEYTNVYRNTSTGFTVGYYSPKEIKGLFPSGGVRVAGQLVCGGDESGYIEVGGVSEKVYRAESSIRYKPTGYIELESGAFLVIKKDILALIITLIVLGLLALTGLAVGIGFAVKASTTPAELPNDPPKLIDPGAELGEGELDIPDKVDTRDRNISFPGIAKMKLVSGQADQTFILRNPKDNPCYFQYIIERDDTGEVIFTSELIPPGYHIKNLKFNKPVEEGDYNVTVHIKTFSFDKEQNPLNNMDIKTTISAHPAESE